VNFQRLDRVREMATTSGLTVAQMALAWVLNQDFKIFALVGAANAEEIAANVAVAEIRLTAEQMAWLESGVRA